MSKHNISTNNKRIYEFYKNNPSIEFDTMNLIMIDFIEKLNMDLNKTISNTINGEILSSVKELKEQLTNVGHNFNESITSQNKDYIENIKMIIQLSSTQESDKIIQQLNRNTEQRIFYFLPWFLNLVRYYYKFLFQITVSPLKIVY